MTIERHDLVWLVAGWRDLLLAPLEAEAESETLARAGAWIALGLPAVAARRDPRAPRGVALGIALPGHEPDARRRVSLVVAPEAVARVARPLRLAEALASAPAAWKERLAALDGEARAAGLSLGLYGSLAWQHLSGVPYVTARSDVDLLVHPRSAPELRAALALLREHAGDRAPALDGELLLGGGRAVAWRELLGGAARLLVKSGEAVALEPAGAALGALAEGAFP